MKKGKIVCGVLAPHPPHLIYAANPVQNEPRSSGAGAWQSLHNGYEKLRSSLEAKEFDVFLVHTPHWKTRVGHHFLGVAHFQGHSVDPVFPNLFRYSYDLSVDVPLAEAIALEAKEEGLETSMMRNPDFRVDYGTLTSCHLARPAWDKPIVCISSAATFQDYSSEASEREMMALGRATKRAVENLGRKAVLLASTSLSHRHYTNEPADPEDPQFESIYNANQAAWDEKILALFRQGKAQQVLDEMPDFAEQALTECREGGLTWLLSAMGIPDFPATVHGYGTVIGTGNAVVEWDPTNQEVRA
jgi:2-aminophenol/2-amino-5-chlorophenol 1,6-dioxygenase beta subunit